MPVQTRSSKVKTDGTAEDRTVREHLGVLRKTFGSGKTRDLKWRKEQLRAFRKLCVDNREALCEALRKDLHKCKFEAYFFEVNQLEHEINDHLEHIDEWVVPERVGTDLLNLPGSSFIKRDPLGVCCILGAWNYPVLLSMQPLVGCIAAGNCALVKMPSNKYSSHTSKCLADLCGKYLDRSAIRVVEGDRHMTQAILKCRYDKYFFTGGSYVGKMVYEAAARELTPAVLELGGKSPCVVDRSASITTTAYRLAQGKWANAGQTCIAPDYLLVHEDIADEFLDKLQEVTRSFFGDDPKTSEDFGRLINQRAYDNAKKLVDASVKYLRFGGQTDRNEKYVSPSIYDFGTDAKAFAEAALMKDEIFAPLLPVLRYKRFDDVVEFVTQREKPLSFYMYANDRSLIKRAYDETTSGAFVANDCLVHMSNHELPFGGVGRSGLGSYHGKHSFECFSHKKACMVKPAWADILLRLFRYPRAGRSDSFKRLVFNITYAVQYPYRVFPKVPLLGLIMRGLVLAFLFNLALSFDGFRQAVRTFLQAALSYVGE